MANDTNNSKLDQVVKQTLSNYEAAHSTPDWAKMESMLNAAPQPVNFKWSYSLNVIIGLVILGGGLLIYSLSSSEKSSTTTTSEPQQPIENTATPVTKKTITVPPPSIPVVAAPAPQVPSQKNTLPVGTAVETVKKETIAPDKINNKKTDNIVKEDKEKKPVQLKQVINTMGNEPIFGDMLDSSKGIVGKTKEKEETKKAARAQPEKNTIGWSSFLLKNNLDSLKKYHEQQQKDSLKK